MLADFHFIRPEWLLLVPAVVALAVLLAKRQLGAGATDGAEETA